MAPSATITSVTQESSTPVIKIAAQAAATPAVQEEEEQECFLGDLSRGPNPLAGVCPTTMSRRNVPISSIRDVLD